MPPGPRLPEPFVFYVDECLGRTIVPDALRAACSEGETVVSARRGALDAEWIIEAGQQGWLCFSKDHQMLKRPIERNAIVYSRIALFTLREGSGAEHARIICDTLPSFGPSLKSSSGPSSLGWRAMAGSLCTSRLASDSTRRKCSR